MITVTIKKEEAGRRLARFLEKLFPKAPRGLFHKALRNKKIKINGKKPEDLSVIVNAGDEIRIFFTDEQLVSFGYKQVVEKNISNILYPSVPILYEDTHLLVLDKPVGMLSQKSKPEDVSLNEIGCSMIEQNQGSLQGYRPGVCNRLDRNTSGVVIMAKTLQAGQAISKMFRDHCLGKFYWAIVEGVPQKWKTETTLIHGWNKDESKNKALLVKWNENLNGYQRVESRVKMLKSFDTYSLVEIQLLTGKSHQIRSQLAAEGYPILQDGKYNSNAKEYKQMLVAKRLEFWNCIEPLQYLQGKKIEASLPKDMEKFL